MVTVNTASLSTLIPIYWEKRMLERLVPNLIFHQFGEKKELPKNEGNQIYWHRWNTAKMARLIAESGAGAGEGLSATRISATLLMIGHHAKVTTYIDMVSINSVVQGAIDLFADSSVKTLDFITSRLLLWHLVSVSASLQVSSAAGYIGDLWYTLSSQAKMTAIACSTLSCTKWRAPVFCINDLTTRNHSLSGGCAGGGATGVCATSYSPNVLRKIRLKLRVKNALPFEDGFYKAIIHPDMVHQLRSSSGFIDLHKYTETGNVAYTQGLMRQGTTERGLVGVMEGFKFYESTEAPLFSTSGVWGGVANGNRAQPSAFGDGRFYFTYFFGKGSYGVTDFDGGIRTFIKTPGPSSTDNPLNLYSTVGYRMIYAARVLQSAACLWIVNGRPTEGVGA